MGNWYHTLKGSYNIATEAIHLDFSSHVGDSKQLEATFVHESMHAALADYEFGLATQTAHQIMPYTKDLSEEDRLEMMRLLVNAQDFVQEGLATLFQFLWLAQEMGKKNALELAQKVLPKEYLEKLEQFYFVFDFAPRQRDAFTQTISRLAMETGIREVAPTADLFGSVENIKKYLADEDCNPNERLKKLIESTKYYPWLLTKTPEEIASKSGVTFHAPTSKKDVAAFQTYMSRRMGNTRTYTESEIGDPVNPDDFFLGIAEDVVIGNLNQKFSGQGEILFNLADFLHYSDVADIVFITPYRDTDEERDRLAGLIHETPEIVLGMIASTGAKYVTAVSRATAERILKNELQAASLIAKAGAFNPTTNEMIESPTFRHPDVVIYNTGKHLRETLEEFRNANPNTGIAYFYASAMEGHTLRTLYVKIDGQVPIYAVNTFGGIGVDQIIELLGDKAHPITAGEIRADKNHYNNFFVFWLGMFKEVDWVETMLDVDKKHAYFRDGRVLALPK